ncbi:MAG: HepT-like ribonuclease domain-containing protein [Thermoproteota archaeon]
MPGNSLEKDGRDMGDKLIHEYFGVDLRRVWKTV